MRAAGPSADSAISRGRRRRGGGGGGGVGVWWGIVREETPVVFRDDAAILDKRKNDCGAGDNGGKYSGGPEKEILVDGAVVGWRSAAECGYVSETGQPSPLFLVRYQVVASPSSASPSSSLSSLFEEDLDACDLVDLLVPDMTEADEAVRASLAQKATENEDSGRNDDNNDAEDDASGGGGGRDGEGAPRVRHHLTLCGPFVSFVDGGGAACDEGADFARRRSRECGLSTLAAARVNRSHDSNCPGLWDAGGLVAPSSTATLMLLRSLLPPRLMRMRGHGPNGGDDESLDDDDEEHNDDDLDDDIGDRGSTLPQSGAWLRPRSAASRQSRAGRKNDALALSPLQISLRGTPKEHSNSKNVKKQRTATEGIPISCILFIELSPRMHLLSTTLHPSTYYFIRPRVLCGRLARARAYEQRTRTRTRREANPYNKKRARTSANHPRTTRDADIPALSKESLRIRTTHGMPHQIKTCR